VEIIVLGAGMAGLMSALALAPAGHQIAIFERDGPPPPCAPDEIFHTWRRHGASQLRHTHAFRARLTNLLRDEHPAFFSTLSGYGMRKLSLADAWPSGSAGAYIKHEFDDRLAPLVGRRTTLETALRRYLDGLPNVRFHDGEVVTGLIAETAAGCPSINGVNTRHGPAKGDIVIDAAGRLSPIWDWLDDLGGAVAQSEVQPAGIVYFTQFYRFRQHECLSAPVVGDMGYLQFGVIPAEDVHFSITLAIPERDLDLRRAASRPETFAAMIDRIPAAATWAQKACAVGRPIGMGDLKSRWRGICAAGRPVALNLFPVGDSLILTNPLYGRGCTLAGIEAHLLRDVLRVEPSATGRAILYTQRVWRELRAVFDDMRARDQAMLDRMEGRAAAKPVAWWRSLIADYVKNGQGVAARTDPPTIRAALRAFHLLDPPHAWKRHPRTLVKSLQARIDRSCRKTMLPVASSPSRDELLFGLAPDTDAAATQRRAVAQSRTKNKGAGGANPEPATTA
jgi:2-polyprenyl-6-methoxyphenol hydroxylase-like FAD-dependent oxidoreductase